MKQEKQEEREKKKERRGGGEERVETHEEYSQSKEIRDKETDNI